MGDENSVFGLKNFFFFNTNAIDYEMATSSPDAIPFALSHTGSLFFPFHHIHLPRFKKLQTLYEYNIQRHSLLPPAGEGRG